MGTPLYDSVINYDNGNKKHSAIMLEVWSATPFMIDVRTGSPNSDTRYDMALWCRKQFGDQHWPPRIGSWQFGNATVDGWNWIGFDTAEKLEAFKSAFPEYVEPSPQSTTDPASE